MGGRREKISKYFCNLEKRHYVSKQMIKLIDAKGEEIKEQLDINKEVNFIYIYIVICIKPRT